ncbi:DUF4349 domain-containing protein [Candidatus Pacearchaeota archaeon]|nr:DUF4349 domain-containing protein [Candidatus Pacearchaeota archaeon]
MGIKKQFSILKENWLLIILAIVLFVFLSGGSGFLNNIATQSGFDNTWSRGAMESMAFTDSAKGGYYPGFANSDFAPETEERKIIKTASLSTEIGRGSFKEAEDKLKNIITLSDAYLLNEQVSKQGDERKSYYYGYYQLKVDVEKYDSAISQLKEIGIIQSFNENTNDVTGRYTNLAIEIEVEKQRLLKYEQIYANAESVSDQIDLSDRIFNQERTIKYLEDSLKNIDQRVDYSSIYFTMNEERSEYYDVIFIKLSTLIKNLVGSFNTLIQLVFVLIPWALALLLIIFGWKHFKKK